MLYGLTFILGGCCGVLAYAAVVYQKGKLQVAQNVTKGSHGSAGESTFKYEYVSLEQLPTRQPMRALRKRARQRARKYHK